ncbi:MAG: trimethylamine methyltransferase family protein [Desulfohalobiaceae bacterium]
MLLQEGKGSQDQALELSLKEESKQVLQDVGVKCTDKRVIETFEKTNLAAYDETTQRIHIMTDLIDSCLASTPKRDSFPVPQHSFGGGGVAMYVKRGDDFIVPTTEIHVAEMMDMAEHFQVPFMFKSASAKFTPEEEEKQIQVMRRYYSGFLYVRAQTDVGISKAEEEHNKTGLVCTTHSPLLSPLKFNEPGNNPKAVDNIDIFMRCAQKNLPLYITSMPITCLTAPATIYGIALQAYAEFLAGLSLAQSIQPGVTVVNGAFPAAGNPSKGYGPELGVAFHNIANWVTSRVGDADSLPSIQSGCTISGKQHNPIEGGTDLETERGYKMWNAFDRWHQVRHAFGFIDDLAAIDLDKMQRDMVSLDRVLSNREGVDVCLNDFQYDREAQSAIQEGVEKDDFRFLNHTTSNMGIFDCCRIIRDVTIGVTRQEKKITKLSQLANTEFPDIGVMTFKGVFRSGAMSAVGKSQFNSWEEVASEPPDTRREFFKSLLEESRAQLEQLIGKENVPSLLEKLLEENERYLQD